MRNFGRTNPHGTAFAPKQWLYQKKATGMERSKIYCPSRCRYRTYRCVAENYPVSREVVHVPEWKHAEFRPYQSPWYSVCTEAMVISKLSYRHGEFVVGSIEPRMKICGTSGLPIPMVPHLYQSNGYIKRKLRAWRVQKYITLVGAGTVLTSVGPQTTPSHGG